MDYRKQFKSEQRLYVQQILQLGTGCLMLGDVLPNVFGMDRDDPLVKELRITGRHLHRLSSALKKRTFEDLKLWVKKPCDEIQSCRVKNEAPDLSYDEWVETYCGACPDCVFKLEPKAQKNKLDPEKKSTVKETRMYILLKTDGSCEAVNVEKDELGMIGDSIRKLINCDYFEVVHLKGGYLFLVDELGKIRQDPKKLNHVASLFYPGTQYGDYIVGDVLIGKIVEVDSGEGYMEHDVGELNDHELKRIMKKIMLLRDTISL